MTRPSSRIRAAAAAGALAVAAAVTGAVFATSAQAAETDDPRAVAFDGNVSTCEGAELAGEIIDPSDLTYEDGEIDVDQSVTITGVAEGVTVTGIVVKGGNAYNVYEPGLRELPADVPWEDLVAPINDGGQQPALSHWFVCGTVDTPPSSEPPSSEPSEPSEEPSEPSEEPSEPSEEPSEPSEEPSEPSEEPSEEPTTTTTDAPDVAAEEDDDLALTGFGAGWLIPIGALLLVGGGAALWLARNRRSA